MNNQFQVPGIVHAGSLEWLIRILKWNRAIVNSIYFTCDFPAMTIVSSPCSPTVHNDKLTTEKRETFAHSGTTVHKVNH